MFRLLIASLVAGAATAGTPDNVSSRLMIHVSCCVAAWLDFLEGCDVGLEERVLWPPEMAFLVESTRMQTLKDCSRGNKQWETKEG